MTISFNIGLLPNRPINECIEISIKAEELGFDGIWEYQDYQTVRYGPHLELVSFLIQLWNILFIMVGTFGLALKIIYTCAKECWQIPTRR